MSARKSSKVKDLPRKSLSSKKAANVKGGARQRLIKEGVGTAQG